MALGSRAGGWWLASPWNCTPHPSPEAGFHLSLNLSYMVPPAHPSSWAHPRPHPSAPPRGAPCPQLVGMPYHGVLRPVINRVFERGSTWSWIPARWTWAAPGEPDLRDEPPQPPRLPVRPVRGWVCAFCHPLLPAWEPCSTVSQPPLRATNPLDRGAVVLSGPLRYECPGFKPQLCHYWWVGYFKPREYLPDGLSGE